MAQQCRARVSLPNSSGDGDVLFTCNLAKGHSEPSLDGQYSNEHTEVGRVRAKDGTVRSYKVTWTDLPPEVWRDTLTANRIGPYRPLRNTEHE